MNETTKESFVIGYTVNNKMKQSMISEAMDRIRQMEMHFDMLQNAANTNPAAVREDSSLKESLRILRQYYESGQWLHDYELDEKSVFPENLKRGVLSQDGVFDLLDRITRID